MEYDLRKFDPDVFIGWFEAEAKAGRMTSERFTEPNWGVSPEFLLNAAFDCNAAERAKWMKPFLFLTGVAIGMLGSSVMILIG